MITLLLAFFALPATPSPCQQIGPRLDGTYVTVCQGRVVAVRDQLGNSRVWERATGRITVRAPGARPLVLEAAPVRISLVD